MLQISTSLLLIFTITMSTITELKLLTLLNVSAIKRPRDMDQPGGFRGSPAFSCSSSAQSLSTRQPGAPAAKKRKSVVWGGELGPSGSTLVTKGHKGKAIERKSLPESAGTALEYDDYEADDSDEGEAYGSTGMPPV
jgi:U3 small nucleolar RNA-associated protein 25